MAAKTVITAEPKDFFAPILYTFRNGAGAEIQIEAHNYEGARRALNKQIGKEKGYKLIERRL